MDNPFASCRGNVSERVASSNYVNYLEKLDVSAAGIHEGLLASIPTYPNYPIPGAGFGRTNAIS